MAIPGGASTPSGDEVLPDLAEALVAAAAPPQDGVLSADVTFTLGVEAAQTPVTVSADAGNASVDDLVADVNAALERAGIGGSMTAGRLGDRLALRGLGALADADLAYAGSAPGELNNPESSKFNSEGMLYVADLKNDRIQVFDANGTFLDS